MFCPSFTLIWGVNWTQIDHFGPKKPIKWPYDQLRISSIHFFELFLGQFTSCIKSPRYILILYRVLFTKFWYSCRLHTKVDASRCKKYSKVYPFYLLIWDKNTVFEKFYAQGYPLTKHIMLVEQNNHFDLGGAACRMTMGRISINSRWIRCYPLKFLLLSVRIKTKVKKLIKHKLIFIAIESQN